MSGFLFFFANANITTAERIPAECDLAHVLDGAALSFRHVDNFQGHSGTLVSIHPAPKSGGTEAVCVYEPDKQTWIDVTTEAGTLTHFVGMLNDAKPTPADLIRPDACGGTPLELAGETWIVPIVHRTLPKLPRFIKGKMSLEVDPRYQALIDQAQRFVSHYLGEEVGITHQEAFEFAVGCLAVNYRLGLPEMCLLNLLNTHSVLKVIEAGLGVLAYEEELASQKKNKRFGDCYVNYRMWRAGLLPDYLPSWLDYWFFRDDCYSSPWP